MVRLFWLYKPSTNRLSHVNGKQPRTSYGVNILPKVSMSLLEDLETFRFKFRDIDTSGGAD